MTPELVVFVAPASVTDADDPAAFPIGTISTLAPGSTPTGAELNLTADGKAELARIMGNYKTPFNVLVSAKLGIGASDPLPAGRLDAVVKIRAHAAL